MNTPKFEVKKSPKDNQFYFHLKAGNGEIILSSEGYTTSQACLNGVASVKQNAPHDKQYDRNYNNGSYTFNLKAGNGGIIGRSESYTTASARDKGIEAVKRDAPFALLLI
jgi:uncharacterized protein YegP (UPF0339 family)